MMLLRNILVTIAILLGFVLMLAGCSGRAELFPNSDVALRKTSTQFAADAARRFPYKLEAPRAGEAQARAQVGYVLDVLEGENLLLFERFAEFLEHQQVHDGKDHYRNRCDAGRASDRDDYPCRTAAPEDAEENRQKPCEHDHHAVADAECPHQKSCPLRQRR